LDFVAARVAVRQRRDRRSSDVCSTNRSGSAMTDQQNGIKHGRGKPLNDGIDQGSDLRPN